MSTVDQANSQGSKIISALNVGSGVNIQDLATSLSEAELSPKIEATQGKIDESELKISALAVVKSGISRINTALSNLEDSSTLTTFSATSSATTSVTAAPVQGTSATPGSYLVQASQLAAPTRIISNEFSSATQTLNSGTSFDIVVNQGPSPGVNTTVSVTETTPTGVVNAINTSGIGVSATLINKSAAVTEQGRVTFSAMTSGQSFTLAGITVTASASATAAEVAASLANLAAGGSANASDKLTTSGTLSGWTTESVHGASVNFTSTTAGSGVADLAATSDTDSLLSIAPTQGVADSWFISVSGETGVKNQFSISSTPDLGFSSGSNVLSSAQNAILSVNGIGSINRASNSFSDVISGVSLVLSGTAAATIEVTENLSSLRDSLDEFVSSVNDFNKELDEMADPENTDSDYGGALAGDSSFVALIRKQVKALVDKDSATASGSMSSFRDLGMSFKLSGDIEIDETKYTNAVTNSLSNVREMLTGNTDSQSRYDSSNKGLALESRISLLGLIESDGLLANRETNAASTLESQKEALAELEERMTKAYERYIKQFAAMESIVQRSKSTGDYLEGQFKAMENMYQK
ncbi:MAG: flagellar filament capping protein FliD [Pseudomonadota bacterium]|nr:flagellar filament capping protein FliD [Pseudomonadota bacterium]